MAVVLGSGISNLPVQDLSGLFGGAGEVLQAINQVNTQNADRQKLDDFNRVLLEGREGPPLPGGQAGPRAAVPLTQQERFQEALGLSTQLQVPRNQQIALEIANIEERAIPAQAKEVRSPFTLTRKDAQGNITGQQKLSLTEEAFQNTQLPEGSTIERGTPITQPGTGTDPASVREFQAVTGVSPEQQGSPEYEKAFFDYKEKIKRATEGRKQFVGSTPEGQLVTFDNIDGKFKTEDVSAELLPRNKKLLSGEVAGQLGTFDSIIGQIDDIRTLAKNNPDFIGPTQGRWNKLKSNFVDNKDFVELDRNVESLITIAYALSGKQISEKEMRMLKGAILPSVTQPGANFNTALDFAEKWLTTNRDNRIKRLKGSGFFVGDTDAETGTEDFQSMTPEQLAAEIEKERAKTGGT